MRERDPLFLTIEGVGLFEIVGNGGNGSCLFRAIAQAMSLPEESHPIIRLKTLKHIALKWAEYGPRILSHWTKKLNSVPDDDLPVVGRRKDKGCWPWPRFRRKKSWMRRLEEETVKETYFRRMGEEDEDGSFLELLGAGDLFGFHFDIVQRSWNNLRFIFTGCRTNNCLTSPGAPRILFRFEKVGQGQGHWEFMKTIMRDQPDTPLPLNRKIQGKFFRMDQWCENVGSRIVRVRKDKESGDGPKSESDWPPDSSDDRTGCWSTENKAIIKH